MIGKVKFFIRNTLGIRRRFDRRDFLVHVYLFGREIFSYSDMKYFAFMMREQRSCLLSQIYASLKLVPETHQVFEKYNGSLVGKDLVIMAAGPTLKQYTKEKWIQGALHAGVNKVAISEIPLDYYFAFDWEAICSYGIIEKVKSLKCHKFLGLSMTGDDPDVVNMPLSFVQESEAMPFFVIPYTSHNIIPKDISKHPLMGNHSIISSLFHFALYCQPRRIYLVGCDCSTGGHFDGTQSSMYLDDDTWYLIEEWKKMALFAKYYYPNIEIVSINPVGLKGIFKDQTL